MAYFDCIVGGSGKGNTLVVTCADELAGATITCTNGTKTYTKTCPSTAPYEVTFYGLAAGTYTVSATVSGNTYTTTVVVADIEALLGGFNWKTWVDLSENYTSSDFTDLDDLLSDETAIRELMTIHACVDYLAEIAAASADVEQIIENDYCAKWINNRDYALDTLYANEIIAGYMDAADKYFYGEWSLVGQVPKMTSNTAPYGEVIFSDIYGSGYEAYKAFDGVATTRWNGKNSVSNNYIGYHFATPTCIKLVHIDAVGIGNDKIALGGYKIQGSNDNFVNDIHDLYSGDTSGITWQEHIGIDVYLENTAEYEYYRLYSLGNPIDTALDSVSIWEIQFYAWAPKGNVPVMTGGATPYGTVTSSSQYSAEFTAWKAFDGDQSTSWGAGANTYPQNLSYKFVNPVCAKKAYIYIASMSGSSRVSKWKIQGSNDGSTWEDLTDEISHSYVVGGEYVDIKKSGVYNENYYLYYRAYFISGSYAVYLYTLQFYGRELSVSVPTMTGYTTPYGEVVSSGYEPISGSDSTYGAWHAFDGVKSGAGHLWRPEISGTTHYVGYKFVNSTCVKKVVVDIGSSKGSSSFVVKGSNDNNTWYPLSDSVTVEQTSTGEAVLTTKIVELSNDNTYRYCKLEITSTQDGNWRGITVGELQFYGLDYSEKEFEEGTNKKWLYDHGVELETLTAYGNGVKEVNCLAVTSGASGGFNTALFDLTPYDLLRAKIYNATAGNGYYGDIIVRDSSDTTLAELFFAQNMLPNNMGVKVDSINQNAKVIPCNIYNNYVEFAELWLE